MPAEEQRLDELIEQVESNGLEFKLAKTGYDLETAIDYCAAIANEGGGFLVLGITNKLPREVVGTTAFRDVRDVEFKVYERLKIKVVVREVEYRGKRVVTFQIPRRRIGTPVEHKGRFLTRAGESLTTMSAHRIGEILDEGKEKPEKRVIMTDLDAQGITGLLDVPGYFKMMPDTEPDNLEDALLVLERRDILTRGRVEGTWGITMLGALAIARDFDSFSEIRLRRVRLIRYSGSDRINAVFENFDNRGYLIAFDDIVSLVSSMSPIREVIEVGRRQTTVVFPPVAVREILANALIHQDLTEDSVQLTIEMFSDRLEIRNPGRPLIDVQRFVDETQARNPQLAELMRLARICEVRGSGVDRALDVIESAFQPAPRFEADTAATVVVMRDYISFMDMAMEERVWATFLHCCLRYERGERLTNTSLRARFGLLQTKAALVSQTISTVVDIGLIKIDPSAGNSKRAARYIPFFVN